MYISSLTYNKVKSTRTKESQDNYSKHKFVGILTGINKRIHSSDFLQKKHPDRLKEHYYLWNWTASMSAMWQLTTGCVVRTSRLPIRTLHTERTTLYWRGRQLGEPLQRTRALCARSSLYVTSISSWTAVHMIIAAYSLCKRHKVHNSKYPIPRKTLCLNFI